jgi:DNA-binding CsgD family transcriptional regulator
MTSTTQQPGQSPFDATVPTQFQRESVALIARLIPLSSSAFYLVGTDMLNRGAVLLNLDMADERKYHNNYRELDPLNPALFARSGEALVCIDELLSEQQLLASRYYQEFMRPLNHRHVADMFLRHGQEIIAVLSMLRDASLGPFSSAELALARALQPFLEYTLNAVYRPRRFQERATLQADYRLTEREINVLELILGGASNKQIANELGVGLATVKTHIQHVFQKFDVSSRTALVARVRMSLKG